MPHGLSGRNARAAFTLIEMLIVILTLGILAGAGIRFYASLTRDTRMRTATDHLNAFLAACRRRAAERGLPVHLVADGQRIVAVDAPALTFAGDGWSPASRARLGGLVFSGNQVLDASGTRLTRLDLAFELPGGGIEPVRLELGQP